MFHICRNNLIYSAGYSLKWEHHYLTLIKNGFAQYHVYKYFVSIKFRINLIRVYAFAMQVLSLAMSQCSSMHTGMAIIMNTIRKMTIF